MRKPKVMIDMRRAGQGEHSKRDSNVNLSDSKIVKIPFITVSKIAVVGVVLSYLIFGSALAPIDRGQFSLAAQNEEERQQLEQQLEELEAQIAKDQETLNTYKSQGKNLQSEIDRLNAKINKINLQIKAVNLSLQKLDKEISLNKDKMTSTQGKIDQNVDVLERSLQNIYVSENISVVEILLRNPKLSDFFGNITDLFQIQESLRGTLEKLKNLHDELLDQKEQLVIQKNDVEELKAYQATQKESLSATKSDKSNLLMVTKGNEKKYQELVKEKQKTAADIRNRIFRFLGGGELAFGEAVKIAQVAEKATGVRAALILAVLTQESSVRGVIGANLGKCYYNTPRKNPSGSVMSNSQKPAFLALMSALGLDPEKTPVSCPISSDGTYGGAIGPAQFMPNTWNIYKDRISSLTGGDPASPFNNLDAFTGTALYLKDSLNASSCKNYANQNSGTLPYQFLLERCAAARYYAGGNWYAHRLYYGDDVATRADKFQSDIDILDN